MCGIFCTISRDGHVSPSSNATRLLQERGPDCFQEHRVTLKDQVNQDVFITFSSSVLSLRGDKITTQPLVDQASGCVLCWNGEAWKLAEIAVNGNDSIALFELLLQAVAQPDSHSKILEVLEKTRGPFALVFYDGQSNKLYFGRDCLGRRSLLKSTISTGAVIISSVCDLTISNPWFEIEADGVHVYDLAASALTETPGHFGEELIVPYTVSLPLPLSQQTPFIVSSVFNLVNKYTDPVISLFHTVL
jgi:asparagine synthetase B (glutamine-hydrolysing)